MSLSFDRGIRGGEWPLLLGGWGTEEGGDSGGRSNQGDTSTSLASIATALTIPITHAGGVCSLRPSPDACG